MKKILLTTSIVLLATIISFFAVRRWYFQSAVSVRPAGGAVVSSGSLQKAVSGGADNTSTARQLSDDEKDEIIRDYNKYDAVLSKAMLSSSPEEECKALIPFVESFSTVEKAWFDRPTFWVKVKNGGTLAWKCSGNPLIN